MDFDDIAESSFHRDCSLLVDDGAGNSMDFPDIADSSFREIENISLDDGLQLADEPHQKSNWRGSRC